MENKTITITIEELKAALETSDLILPVEVSEVYRAMLATPEFGVRVAGALQAAMKAARTPEAKNRVLDAAVLPAFIVGLLVGRGQGKRELEQSGGHT